MLHPEARRSTLTVDLGPELSQGLRAAAAAQCVTPSQWTRVVLQHALQSGDRELGQPGQPQKPERAGRLDLDLELAQMLETIKTEGQFRSRPAALRLVLRQFFGQGKGQAAPAPIDVAPLKDVVAALMRANHELVPIGRNLNQVAKALNQQRVSLRLVDEMTLQDAIAGVKAHVDQAAKVSAALSSLITPHNSPRTKAL